MKKAFLIAASLTLLSATAFAQGNSPYNRSGPQAGGPRAGMERAMGAPGGTAEMDPAMRPGMRPMGRPMMRHQRRHRMMHHRRHRM